MGLLSLAKKYGKDRLEAACRRANAIGGKHYKHIASILSTSLDQVPLGDDERQPSLPLLHDNVRGAGYYH